MTYHPHGHYLTPGGGLSFAASVGNAPATTSSCTANRWASSSAPSSAPAYVDGLLNQVPANVWSADWV